jgi:hypothetical protein
MTVIPAFSKFAICFSDMLEYLHLIEIVPVQTPLVEGIWLVLKMDGTD